MLLASEVEAHKLKCVNMRKFCDKCELVFYPNRPGETDFDTHDCIKELTRRHQETEFEHDALAW